MKQTQSSAARVMAILEAIGSADAAQFPDGMTVADVSRVMERDKSVVSRQLKSLLETGLIARDPEGRYELSWRLFVLAQKAGGQRLKKIGAPFMFRLTELVRERTYMSVLSDGEVLTVHSESSRRSIEASGWVGRTVPVSRSSSGMALLLDHEDDHIIDIVRGTQAGIGKREAQEFLGQVQQARLKGYTLANRIFDPELLGIGAPVRDYSGRITAAVNVSGPATRIEPHIEIFSRHLLSTVRNLQHALSLGPNSSN